MKKYFSDKINHKAKGKKGARVLALMLSFVLAATPQLGSISAWAEPAPADAPQASSEPDLEVPVVYDSLTGEVVEQSGGYIPSAADYNTPVANEDLTPQKAESMIAPGLADEEELSAEKAWEDAVLAAYPYAYTNTSDLQDYFADEIMPTRDQNPYGSCWAHAVMAAMELYLVKQKGSNPATINLSERHLARFTYGDGTGQTISKEEAGDSYFFNVEAAKTSDDWDDYGFGNVSSLTDQRKETCLLDRGGNSSDAAQTLIHWKGAADETVAPYRSGNSSTKSQLLTEPSPSWLANEYNDTVRMQNMYMVNIEGNPELVKRYIREYGGVTSSYYHLSSGYSVTVNGSEYSDFINTTTNAYRCPLNLGTNHAITIVGWDDNYPKSNFIYTPANNGAWLIRNSWNANSTNFSVYTYFWMSYEDASLADTAYVFTTQDNKDWLDHNYYYDACVHNSGGYSYNATRKRRAANVFTVSSQTGKEVLEAVTLQCFYSNDTAYGSEEGLPYRIWIYKNLEEDALPDTGELALTQEGSLPLKGAYTIPLEKGVVLAAGERFSVVVQLDGGKIAPDMEFDHGVSPTDPDDDPTMVYTCVNSKPGQSYDDYGYGFSDLSDHNYCIGAQTMDVPTLSAVADAENRQVTLTWTKPALAEGYEIRRSSTENGTYTSVYVTDTPSVLTYTDTVPAGSDDCFYKIYRRKDGVTNETSASDPIYVSLTGQALQTLDEDQFSISKTSVSGTYNGSAQYVTFTGPQSYTGTLTIWYKKIKNSDGTDTDGIKTQTRPTDAGTYQVIVDASSGGEYAAASGLTDEDWNFTIAPATITVTPADKTKQVGEADPVFTYTTDTSNLVYGQTMTLQGSLSREQAGEESGEAPGEYAITLGTLSLKDNSSGSSPFYAADYKLVLVGNHKLTIMGSNDLSRATMSFTGNSSYEYDGTAHQPGVSVTYNGETLTQDVDYTLSYSDNVHAGENTATVTVAGKGNYTGEKTLTFTIEPAELIVIPQNASKTEGNADPEFTYTVDDTYLVSGQHIGLQGALSREKAGQEDGEDPGEYEITRGSLSLKNDASGTERFYASDYTLVVEAGHKLTILDKPKLDDALIQITDTDTPVYDGTPKKPSVSVTYNGTGLEQDVDYTLTYSDNVHAGDNTAKITAKGIGNYEGEQTISFTIDPRQLTVKAQNASKTINAADPDFTYSVTNAVDTDRIIFTGALSREEGETTGDYEINQGTLALADGERYLASDYSIVFTVGSFTIDEQARWNVYFDPQNGNASILMYAVDGGTVQVPAEPYLEGYDFTGWYTDEDCTQEYDFSTGVTSDLTLYAGWEVTDDHSDIEYRNGYAATCGLDGYEGDIYCKKCGAYLGQGNTIPATGLHNWVLTATDPATSLHTGTAYYSCSECSATKTEILDIDPNNKDPYDYDDWDDDDWDDDDDEWDEEELEEIEEELEEKGFTLNDDEETVTFQKPAKKTITSCKISPTVKVNGYTFKITGIADNAFKGCSKLKKVTIGSNVTTIGANAFKSCGKLTSVTIPAKVTHIGKNAFNGCKSLKTITIKTKSLKKIGKKAFSGIKGGAKFKLPKLNAAKKRSYKKMIKGSGAPKSSKIK